MESMVGLHEALLCVAGRHGGTWQVSVHIRANPKNGLQPPAPAETIFWRISTQHDTLICDLRYWKFGSARWVSDLEFGLVGRDRL